MTRKRSLKGVIITCTVEEKELRECVELCKENKELWNVSGGCDYYEWFKMFLAPGRVNPFYVALYKKKVIGFVVGESNTGYVLVQLLAVGKKYRSYGIGRKLLKCLEKYAVDNQNKRADHFLVYAHVNNELFFKRMGYIRGSPCIEYMKVIP